MTPELERDLTNWEAGELDLAQLAARHGAEAEAVARTYDRLRRVSLGSAPDAEAGWAALVERLDAATPLSRARHRRYRRTGAIAIAAALLVGGTAFAATGTGVFHHTPAHAPGSDLTADKGLPSPSDQTGAPLEDGHDATHQDGASTAEGPVLGHADANGPEEQGAGGDGTDGASVGAGDGNGSESEDSDGNSDDTQGQDTQGDDTQGDGTQDGSQSGDPQGDDTQNGDSQGDDQQSGDDQGADSQDQQGVPDSAGDGDSQN
jgi:hypothetical protein